ncbi:uncharacterized protein LOC115768196 [Drosophila novamexicana]|uniref:uncharacterized protein LOC115768196 n=1 Tax=Drosophila novamexicana TaxID=47314 RepID=UPI0011E595FE|nr:uncharacterized protein LOC115768196 [Drosophila novamexicana]
MSQQRLAYPRGDRAALIFGSAAIFLLLQLLQLAEVTGYRALIPADSANPGKCIYRGDLLQAGINNGIPPCQRLTCNDDGSILIEGCGKLRIEKCNRGERIHQSKPFPECCLLRYKCKQPNSAPYYIERDAAEGA